MNNTLGNKDKKTAYQNSIFIVYLTANNIKLKSEKTINTF